MKTQQTFKRKLKVIVKTTLTVKTKGYVQQQGRNLGGYGGGSAPNIENLPFRKAKTVVQSASAGHLTGPRTIGELLLLKKKSQTKTFCRVRDAYAGGGRRGNCPHPWGAGGTTIALHTEFLPSLLSSERAFSYISDSLLQENFFLGASPQTPKLPFNHLEANILSIALLEKS